MINSLKKKIVSTSVALTLVSGAGLALATPAQAAGMTYWFHTKSACVAALDKARPGFGSFVRLVHGCQPNGTAGAYDYEVAYRTS